MAVGRARGQRLVVVQRVMHGDDEPCAAKGVDMWHMSTSKDKTCVALDVTETKLSAPTRKAMHVSIACTCSTETSRPNGAHHGSDPLHYNKASPFWPGHHLTGQPPHTCQL